MPFHSIVSMLARAAVRFVRCGRRGAGGLARATLERGVAGGRGGAYGREEGFEFTFEGGHRGCLSMADRGVGWRAMRDGGRSLCAWLGET